MTARAVDEINISKVSMKPLDSAPQRKAAPRWCASLTPSGSHRAGRLHWGVAQCFPNLGRGNTELVVGEKLLFLPMKLVSPDGIEPSTYW